MFDEDSLLSLLEEYSQEDDSSAIGQKVDVSESRSTVKREINEADNEKNEAFVDSVMKEMSEKPDMEKVEQAPKDISEFSRDIYSDAQLIEIKKGLDHRLDVDVFSDVRYSGRQMREIRYGLERGLDISYYANPYFRERQMKEIRIGLQDGLDVSSYARLVYSATDMKEKRLALYKEKYADQIKKCMYDYDDKETGLHVYVEEGLMEAGIVLKKPLSSTFKKSDLRKLMKSYDINYGFAEDELPSNLANLPLNVKIPIMFGIHPVEGTDGVYEYTFDIEEEKKPVVKEDGSVEYFAPKAYKNVKRGDVVAIYHPATKGESGLTVTGYELEGMFGNEAEPLVSDDIILTQDKTKYLSKKEGVLTYQDGKVKIIDFLEFKNDVTYMDGKITFDGTVKINGNVLDNAEIVSSGDIIISGKVTSCKLTAGGDVVITGGANGDETGSIIAKGKITAAFLENITVESGSDIEVGYALNSNIKCDGVFTTKGKKSLVCGGSVSAARGMVVGTLGSKAMTKTIVEVGSVSDDSEEYTALYKDKSIEQEHIKKIKETMGVMIQKLGPVPARQNEQFIKLQTTLDEYERVLKDIQAKLDELDAERIKRNSITVQVTQRVHENTIISVNGNRIMMKEDHKGTVFQSEGRGVVYS